MIFLSKGVIFRFHVNFLGGILLKKCPLFIYKETFHPPFHHFQQFISALWTEAPVCVSAFQSPARWGKSSTQVGAFKRGHQSQPPKLIQQNLKQTKHQNQHTTLGFPHFVTLYSPFVFGVFFSDKLPCNTFPRKTPSKRPVVSDLPLATNPTARLERLALDPHVPAFPTTTKTPMWDGS